MLVLRWLNDDTDAYLKARGAGISQATSYRYLHEAFDVIAKQAPDLHDVLAAGLHHGSAFVGLGGTLIETKHFYTKLGTSSRRAAVLSAHQRGLISPTSD